MSYELVKVMDRTRLLNRRQILHRYATRSGRPLPRGIYVVTSPDGTRVERYSADLAYHGPFASWRLASGYAESLTAARATLGGVPRAPVSGHSR